MNNLFRILLFACVFVGGPLLNAGSRGLMAVGAAYAQTGNTPQGLTKLEDKVNDVSNLIRRILFVFVGIGILFAGWRFIQGDPHAWRYTLGVVLGATIIFASGEILQWLQA